ncbi:MAG: YbjQ family protein [bacterium]
MKLLSIEHVPGKEIEVLGLVKGTIVQSKNVGRDFMAGMKTLVGGEIVGYTEMLVEARQLATKRMVDEAEALGADAVIGIRFGSSSVMQGAAEVLAYGTAVRILERQGIVTK